MSYPNGPPPIWYPDFSGSDSLDAPANLVAHDHALFVFVEEIHARENPESDDAVSFLAFVLSGVPTTKFIQVEGEFETCNPNDPDDRTRRKENLNKYFGEPGSIWNLHGGTNHRTTSEWLSFIFRPSTWHIVLIGNKEKGGIPVEREIEGRERTDEREPAGKIVGIAPAHPYYVLRLEEIFSLNHLPDEDFDLEGNRGPVNYPPSPFTPSKYGISITTIEHLDKSDIVKRELGSPFANWEQE